MLEYEDYCVDCGRSFGDVDQCYECLEEYWEPCCVDCCLGDHNIEDSNF